MMIFYDFILLARINSCFVYGTQFNCYLVYPYDFPFTLTLPYTPYPGFIDEAINAENKGNLLFLLNFKGTWPNYTFIFMELFYVRYLSICFKQSLVYKKAL